MIAFGKKFRDLFVQNLLGLPLQPCLLSLPTGQKSSILQELV